MKLLVLFSSLLVLTLGQQAPARDASYGSSSATAGVKSIHKPQTGTGHGYSLQSTHPEGTVSGQYNFQTVEGQPVHISYTTGTGGAQQAASGSTAGGSSAASAVEPSGSTQQQAYTQQGQQSGYVAPDTSHYNVPHTDVHVQTTHIDTVVAEPHHQTTAVEHQSTYGQTGQTAEQQPATTYDQSVYPSTNNQVSGSGSTGVSEQGTQFTYQTAGSQEAGASGVSGQETQLTYRPVTYQTSGTSAGSSSSASQNTQFSYQSSGSSSSSGSGSQSISGQTQFTHPTTIYQSTGTSGTQAASGQARPTTIYHSTGGSATRGGQTVSQTQFTHPTTFYQTSVGSGTRVGQTVSGQAQRNGTNQIFYQVVPSSSQGGQTRFISLPGISGLLGSGGLGSGSSFLYPFPSGMGGTGSQGSGILGQGSGILTHSGNPTVQTGSQIPSFSRPSVLITSPGSGGSGGGTISITGPISSGGYPSQFGNYYPSFFYPQYLLPPNYYYPRPIVTETQQGGNILPVTAAPTAVPAPAPTVPAATIEPVIQPVEPVVEPQPVPQETIIDGEVPSRVRPVTSHHTGPHYYYRPVPHSGHHFVSQGPAATFVSRPSFSYQNPTNFHHYYQYQLPGQSHITYYSTYPAGTTSASGQPATHTVQAVRAPTAATRGTGPVYSTSSTGTTHRHSYEKGGAPQTYGYNIRTLHTPQTHSYIRPYSSVPTARYMYQMPLQG